MNAHERVAMGPSCSSRNFGCVRDGIYPLEHLRREERRPLGPDDDNAVAAPVVGCPLIWRCGLALRETAAGSAR